MDKTNEYTQEERQLLWDTTYSLFKKRNKGSSNYYYELSRLSDIFRSGNILRSELLPKEAWSTLTIPYDLLPLHINDQDVCSAAIALWRLKIGR